MAFDALGSTVGEAVKGQRRGWSWARADWGATLAAARAALSEQEQHLLLYAPMFLIAGCWAYFQLAAEPSSAFGYLSGAFALGLLLLRDRSRLFLCLGLVLLGFAAAKLRADFVATPMLRGPVNAVQASGFVADIANRSGSAKLLVVELEQATAVPAEELPRRVRLYATDPGPLQIGDHISFAAYFSPQPRPVEPGGFDYGRMLYFQSIGAGGRIIGKPLLDENPVPWRFELRRVFRSLRASISGRITAAIPGKLGHLADSMVSGERSGIPDEMNTSLQISGLAHIISISGLHMSMVAGGVYWAVRAALALVPFVMLRLPIKKIAAVAALLVGLIYTLLADSGSATERSYLMIAVMFFAILVDRPALSLRNLAIAAIVILLVTPEESVGASFQMSFLAVMGIAAFHQWWHRREAAKVAAGVMPDMSWPGRVRRLLLVTGLTTLAASATSTIAAVYHFDRLSPYSVIANGLTMPVSEALVMPPAIIAVLLMPFGLEYWPLKLMEAGLAATMAVSDWIATLPLANLLVAKPNGAGIVLLAAGAGIVAAGAGRFRWVGAVCALVGVMIAGLNARPQVLVEDRAAAVAVMDGDGNYVFASGTRNKFAGGKWLQGNGETSGLIEAESRPGWDCSSGDCFTDLGPMSISYLREKSGQGSYCPPTPVIIADFPLHRACRDARIVIDRIDVWRKGAQAITYRSGRYWLTTARDQQGNRPWAYDSRKGIGTRPAPGEAPLR